MCWEGGGGRSFDGKEKGGRNNGGEWIRVLGRKRKLQFMIRGKNLAGKRKGLYTETLVEAGGVLGREMGGKTDTCKETDRQGECDSDIVEVPV
ncbi:hypothetical protein Pmani_035661 [Petrolisthes manimaculis]|uniref:Uncharacterized protein n=1 Tax=Petrolisthes manimaculis TaxID=1843537 RepID=A0AAE1NL92_9EUCA|nr:hypothetical protein Pmani_035661 [Petrolisthes manimaculis]